MATVPMNKEILDVINAVITYGKFIRSHNYIVPKEDFDHIAEMEKYYHSLPLPPSMSKNRADFEKILQIGWYSGEELERLNNTEQSDLQNTPWKPKRFFEVNLVNYDDNNVPYNVGTAYFSASKQIDKKTITTFCREDLNLDFEEVFSINEIFYDEVLEYVNNIDIPFLDGYECIYNTTDYIPDTKERNTHATAVEICDLFEDVLERFDITLPNDEEGAMSGARLYGTTYDELINGITASLIDFATYNKYSVAKEVDLENFRNAIECLGYNPHDYTKEELQKVFEDHLHKLDNDGTYSAIYNEALSDVLKEYEKTNNGTKSFDISLDNIIDKAKRVCEGEKAENPNPDVALEI